MLLVNLLFRFFLAILVLLSSLVGLGISFALTVLCILIYAFFSALINCCSQCFRHGREGGYSRLGRNVGNTIIHGVDDLFMWFSRQILTRRPFTVYNLILDPLLVCMFYFFHGSSYCRKNCMDYRMFERIDMDLPSINFVQDFISLSSTVTVADAFGGFLFTACIVVILFCHHMLLCVVFATVAHFYRLHRQVVVRRRFWRIVNNIISPASFFFAVYGTSELGKEPRDLHMSFFCIFAAIYLSILSYAIIPGFDPALTEVFTVYALGAAFTVEGPEYTVENKFA